MSERRQTLVWAGLMLAGMAVLVWRLPSCQVETSVFSLMPVQVQDNRLREAGQVLREQAQRRIAFLIGHTDASRAARAADRLAGVLRGLTGVAATRAVVPEGAEHTLLDFYAPHQALMLLPEDQARLESGAAALVDAAKRVLYLPLGLGGSLGFARDPFGMAGRWFLARQGAAGAFNLRLGRMWTEGEGLQWTLVSAEIERRPRDFSGATVLENGLRDARSAALAEPGCQVLRLGFIFHEMAAARQAQNEAGIISTMSALVLLSLLWAAFRRWSAVALVFVPVVAGCLLATAAVLLSGGPLYLITVVFGSTLVGVGEDYGLYLLSGLYEGRPWRPSSRLHRVFRALLLAFLTSVLGYAAFFLVPIGAVHQVGLFSCVGLLGAWLTAVWLFPFAARGLSKPPLAARNGVRWLSGNWPRAGHSLPLALLGLLLLGLSVWGWERLRVNDDVRVLYARDSELQAEQSRAEAMLRSPADGRFFAVEGNDAQAVLEAEQSLRQRLIALEEGLPPALGVSLFVPSLVAQRRARAAWERALPGAANRLAKELEEPDLAGRLIRQFREQSRELRLEDWLASPISTPFHHLWRAGERPMTLLLVPAGSHLTRADLRAVAAEVPGARYVDPLADLADQMGSIRRYLSWGLALGALAVALVLLWSLGKAAWPAVAPTLCGGGLSLAALGWAGLPLNVFGMLALALILGMGVDYGIFAQDGRQGGQPASFIAISVGAVSNLAAFALLAVSSTLALKVVGLVVSVGLGATWMLAMSFSAPANSK